MDPFHRLGFSLIALHKLLTMSPALSDLEVRGADYLNGKERKLYITTHRDMFLEPETINYFLVKQGRMPASISVGKNLFDNPWTTPFLRLQPSHPVLRKGGGRALAEANEEMLSSGIPVWIAQRGGRSVIGSNRTNPHIISNHIVASGMSLEEYLTTTDIVGVAVSSEIESNGPMLARRLVTRNAGEERYWGDTYAFFKSILWPKGRVIISFCRPANGRTVTEITHDLDTKLHLAYPLHETHVRAYAERSRFEDDEWLDAPVKQSMLPPRLRSQVAMTPPRYRAALVTRYALPVKERLEAQAMVCSSL